MFRLISLLFFSLIYFILFKNNKSPSILSHFFSKILEGKGSLDNGLLTMLTMNLQINMKKKLKIENPYRYVLLLIN
jgi:hypothetical protein